MPGITQKLIIRSRRIVHSMIVLLPQDFRSFLNRSNSLTRLFLFFDEARYLPLKHSRSGQKSLDSGHIPLEEYSYTEPNFTCELREELKNFSVQPLISIIVPVFDVKLDWLRAAVQSIENQWYEHWELCLCDDCSSNTEIPEFLESIKCQKIKTCRLSENLGISAASNEALSMASGDFIALMDHDDKLTPDALYEVVKAINEQDAEFIYSDEDKLEMDGSFSEPHFKPDYSPDLVLSQNYLSHLGVIRKSLVDQVGGFTIGLEGAQDYDLYLKVLEQTNKIAHVSRVLYHWRKVPGSTAATFDNKSYAQHAGAKALASAMQRRKVDAEVVNGDHAGTYRVTYAIGNEPLISIIIPFKDKPELLRKCVGSILDKSTYQNFELIGISNKSEQADSFAEMERLEALDARISFHEYNVPFNFSDINNHAVSNYASGEHIVLLNNDIEIIDPNWLENFLEFSQRPDIGVVGGRLYYPDGRLQHAGVIIGIGGKAGHSHKYMDSDSHGYFSRPYIVQNLSAVTAACCMVKRSVYLEVGGMDAHNLGIAFNDVDFCLRIREAGYLNVYTPYVEAWHHESMSRGYETTPEKQKRFECEIEYLRERHADFLAAGDPYYNRNLTLDYEDFSLGREFGEICHQPKLLFMHIPKSAGSTVNRFFASNYQKPHYAIHIESNANWQSDPEQIRKLDFISGHVPLPVLASKLNLNEYFKVTVVREPFTQLVSHLAWVRHLADPGEERRLDRHPPHIQEFARKLRMTDLSRPDAINALFAELDERERCLVDNCLVRYFCAVPPGRVVSDDDLSKALASCDEFDRIGTTEQVGEFLTDIAKMMGWKIPGRYNVENISHSYYGIDLKNKKIHDVLEPLVHYDLQLFRYIESTRNQSH